MYKGTLRKSQFCMFSTRYIKISKRKNSSSENPFNLMFSIIILKHKLMV